MGLFDGKTGLIFGIANKDSIAAAIATRLHEEGATMGFTHLPDRDPERPKNLNRLNKVIGDWNSPLVMPCDVTQDDLLDQVFEEAGKTFGKIDFLLHSIAFAPTDDLKKPTLEVSRDGFKMGMEISVYSLIDLSNRASQLMTDGGSILTMTYYGGEMVVPGYNMMGVCKAALDSSMTYLANDLGPKNIRVNAISAGPLRTLAVSAVGDFREMLKLYESFSPMRRNITHEEVAASAAYLLSDMASGVSGENLHVDAGYHVMGAPPADLQGGDD